MLEYMMKVRNDVLSYYLMLRTLEAPSTQHWRFARLLLSVIRYL